MSTVRSYCASPPWLICLTLVESRAEQVLMVLQDGRTIVVLPFGSTTLYGYVSYLLIAQGTLAGFDQRSNVVLSNSTERVYSTDEGVEEVPLGLYLVKGDMMCVFALISLQPIIPIFGMIYREPRVDYPPNTFRLLIGEVDAEKDSSVDLSTIRADPLPPIRY